jgi:hypothetical protein
MCRGTKGTLIPKPIKKAKNINNCLFVKKYVFDINIKELEPILEYIYNVDTKINTEPNKV